MTTTKTAIENVQKSAATADTEERVCRRFEVGMVQHQGDVYLHMVAEDWPRGAKLGTRQVAVGSSVGARHVAEGAGVEVYEGRQLPDYFEIGDVPEEAYRGPVVVAPTGFVLTHPEHAHHRLPAGVYQVSYQVDPLEQRRVAD